MASHVLSKLRFLSRLAPSITVALLALPFTSFATDVETNPAEGKEPTLYCDALDVMRPSFAFEEAENCELGDAESIEQSLAQVVEGILAITQADLNAIISELSLFRDDYGLDNSVVPFLFNSRTVHNVDMNLALALSLIEQDFAGILEESVFSDIVQSVYNTYSEQKVQAELALGIREQR